MEQRAEIGVFGGSGFYEFAENLEEVKVDTPFGPPSDRVFLGEVCGRRVAFLPRHGRGHVIPPHRINYRANLWAMKSLGVTRIIAPTAVGSLQPNIKPGDFVILDQFVDRTTGRADTFYDGPTTTHISTADPYCPELRKIAFEQAQALGLSVHPEGTVVVIQGPRFSTKAESAWFTSLGWHVVNMTQYPECPLARELEMCYCGIALVTDYDAGLVAGGEVEPVNVEIILKMFGEMVEDAKKLTEAIIAALPEERSCSCGEALKGAQL